jgi:arginase
VHTTLLGAPDSIAESAIVTFDRARIRRMGVTPAVRAGLWSAAERVAALWVHFDVDVLDPSAMPAVVFPEPDGLSVSETQELFGAVSRTLPVAGMSVACYHPRLDPDGNAARVIVDLVSGALPG